MEHSDLRTIAADARKLLFAEFSLFLDDSELGEINEDKFVVTPAMARAVLAAAEQFRTKRTPHANVVEAAAPRAEKRPAQSKPNSTKANPYGITLTPKNATEAAEPLVVTDVPTPPNNGTAASQPVTAAPLEATEVEATQVPVADSSDWPAKLLAAGLDNGDARIVAQLVAGKAVWRNMPRETQRRIVYALIRHIGGGEVPTVKQYDTERPTWSPSTGLLYHAFDEKWSETVAAALADKPAPEVAAPTGAPFRG